MPRSKKKKEIKDLGDDPFKVAYWIRDKKYITDIAPYAINIRVKRHSYKGI